MATFTPDTGNEMFQLAARLVIQSDRNIFLTGKAGTGKTTFLKYIRENCPKQTIVAAPTGVAAINAGGVTLHSLFQLPLSPFIPGSKGNPGRDELNDRHSLLSRLRMNSDKKKLLRELELLIIDEISMVRGDTLDAVDTVLRHVRNSPLTPFGGVQVLLIGDMFQLPPVARDQDWGFLSAYYKSPYFFDSLVMQQANPLYIEFQTIYRQTDESFIRLLNQVRNNELNEEGRRLLESRYLPVFKRNNEDGYIVLTTHNETARQINAAKLRELAGPLFTYTADIEEEFPPTAYPADELLQLKTGAQVMFIRNDQDRNKRYFNGKLGMVTRLEEDRIFVQCRDDDSLIEVQRDTWENIRYNLNKNTRQLEEKRLGSFSQYPLRLAWAITIHKSQGLTFEKAIIDAGNSFAPGQVYVALSRCTSLEGLVLQSRIQASSLNTDQRILDFSQHASRFELLQDELARSQKSYQQKIWLSVFDFSQPLDACRELRQFVSEHTTSFNADTNPWLDSLADTIGALQQTALKFQQQILALQVPGQEDYLQERIRAAAAHFLKEINAIINRITNSPAVTDSRTHAREYNELLKEVLSLLAGKQNLFEEPACLLDIDAYFLRKRKFNAPVLPVNAYAGFNQRQADVAFPQLYQLIKKHRDALSDRKGIPLYLVAGTQTLTEMASFLPQTPDELAGISGFGPARIRQYGQEFLDIILAYCKEHGLESRMQDKKSKRVRKEKPATRTDTKQVTYALYKEGMGAADIAKKRNLAVQTIEGHLAYFVEKGVLALDELLSREKFLMIEPHVKNDPGASLTSIKEKIGNGVSFGEIRLVMAWQAAQQQQTPVTGSA